MDLRVLSCGGTIASEPGDDGAAPAKEGAELLAAVPGLADVADVTVEDVASLPGFDMDPDTVAAVGRRVRAADADGVSASDASGGASTSRRGVDGVVVTQGTDTMCETAYYLDLALSPDVPVVVTGAQRRLDEPSSDAPANLLAAATAASHDRVGGGAYVAFDDELHGARHAVKAHSRALSTVASPGPGPVGERTRDGWRFHREPRGESGDVDALETAADVPVVTSGLGVPGEHLDRHVAAGADGVVLAGTGLGTATASRAAAVRDVDVPVVVASRCHAGGTGAVYGTPGGAVTLASAGALPAGTLSPPKARVKLVLALAAPGAAADHFDAW
jgi:L-asparaginase